MIKKERIRKNVEKDKDLLKSINSVWDYTLDPVDVFMEEVERYIKAIKNRSMLCLIGSVSRSGMSRTIKFLHFRNGYCNFWSLFKALGYESDRFRSNYFRIRGCGMDMIFNTNYNNIHYFGRLGFLSAKAVRTLSQATPTIL